MTAQCLAALDVMGHGPTAVATSVTARVRHRRNLQDDTELPPGSIALAERPRGPRVGPQKEGRSSATTPWRCAAEWCDAPIETADPLDVDRCREQRPRPTCRCLTGLPHSPSRWPSAPLRPPLPSGPAPPVRLGPAPPVRLKPAALDVQRPVVLVDLDTNGWARGAEEVGQLGALVRILG